MIIKRACNWHVFGEYFIQLKALSFFTNPE